MTSRYAELLDYRRAVGSLYAAVRASTLDPAATCRRFRAGRDHLFRTHPQSAFSPERRSALTGLRYHDYDPAYRFVLPVDTAVEPLTIEADLHADGLIRLQRYGRVHFTLLGQNLSLALYWVMGYGGGIFLPFRDLTNDHETYGGGRYVLDTIKQADLGQHDGRLVIDFNYAYNPSCAYDERWVCPLAPAENWLGVRVEAGEKHNS
jgi:uncharacterized protein (DUF1684 family)